LNLASLQTFIAVVETCNLNRAAERLNVTQSTVTARLNGLEEELGQKLFLRRKSGAELTSAGFKFQRYAELMTDLWRQARRESSLPPATETVCNIGCHYDLWEGPGGAFFEALQAAEQRVAVAVWPGEQADMDRWLGSGLVDAAFCFSPTLQEGRTALSLPEDRLILVATRPRTLVRWDPDYIYVDSGEAFRRSHAAAYPDGGTASVTFGSSSWALGHLLRHGGSAYLPERLVACLIEEGKLFPVEGAPRFLRASYLVVNDPVAKTWPWLERIAAAAAKKGSGHTLDRPAGRRLDGC
jgi:DNA-binding transcriptional LysR family regulator